MTETTPYRSGFVAIAGRPNVGKSTLLNHLIGQKLSITSRKPQTTRHRVLGIDSLDGGQIVYVDTPGLHRKAGKAMNRYLNRAATSGIEGVDLVLLVVEALHWGEDDAFALQRVRESGRPCILVINKVDRVADKARLLPFLQEMTEQIAPVVSVPVSAKNNDNLDALRDEILQRLPEGAPLFPEDQLTDRSERFLAAEIVREKLTRGLGDELPYAVTVEIEGFREERGVAHIDALIWVERDNQKAIVIGKGGARLKQVGSQARQDMEALFGRKVFLQLWVKVKEGWADDERALLSLGYQDR